jgi:eukaryotic-like serine/threonine-protein kinase
LETDAAAEPGSQADPLPLPRKLRAVIASRLERLDAAAFELLCTAAVIGREFGFELLVRVSGQSEDDVVRGLDDLWRRRIVREVGAGHYDFGHDKLREVAYGELSLTRRQLLHRYVAEALEALHADDLDRVSGQIAHHYDRAANGERAITYHRRAGDVARRLYANDDAVASYRRASTLLESLPPSEALGAWRREMTAYLCEGLGAISALAGDHEGAREQYGRALEHLPSGSAIRRARLLRSIGATWEARYDWKEALAAFRSAERTLGRAPAGEEAAWWQEWTEVLLARCGIHYWQHDWIAIERLTERVEGVVERYATARQRSRFFHRLANMGFVRARFTGTEATLAHDRAALAFALESRDTRTIASAHFSVGMQTLWTGGIAEAEASLDAALASAERMGDVLLRTRCLTYLAFAHRMKGDLDATARCAEEGLRSAAAAQMPEYEGAAHGHLSWRSWRRGDLAGAERAGRAALAAWGTGQLYPLRWCALLPLLATAIARRRIPDALGFAAALLDPSQQRLPDDLTDALRRAVEAAEDGDAEVVAEHLARAVARAEHARYL